MYDPSRARPMLVTGDTLICVDASPCTGCSQAPLQELAVGARFRVSTVTYGTHCCHKQDVWGVTLVGVQPIAPGGGYVASRFRRLDGFNEPVSERKGAGQRSELAEQPGNTRSTFPVSNASTRAELAAKQPARGVVFESKPVQLMSGSHRCPEEGLSSTEAVAFLAGEPHSETPCCACPVLTNFARELNNALPDQVRTQLLLPLATLLVDTNSRAPSRWTSESENQIASFFASWVCLEIAPFLIKGEGLGRSAEVLRSNQCLERAHELLAGIWEELEERAAPELIRQALGCAIESLRHLKMGFEEKAARYAAQAASVASKAAWHQEFCSAMREGCHPRTVAHRAAQANSRVLLRARDIFHQGIRFALGEAGLEFHWRCDYLTNRSSRAA
jgi:hypothetical protein